MYSYTLLYLQWDESYMIVTHVTHNILRLAMHACEGNNYCSWMIIQRQILRGGLYQEHQTT